MGITDNLQQKDSKKLHWQTDTTFQQTTFTKLAFLQQKPIVAF
jgi:hypothetical protein